MTMALLAIMRTFEVENWELGNKYAASDQMKEKRRPPVTAVKA